MDSRLKLGIFGGAAVTLGALLGGGCPQPHKNTPPSLGLTERNGTEIRTTQNPELARQYGWDEAIVLPINREDVYKNDEKFTVVASDADGPQALTGNFYPVDDTVNVIIENGQNLEDRVTWNVAISGENIPRGMYPLLAGRVSDGECSRTVGILGAISRGESIEPNDNQPYVPGDGICEPLKGENWRNSPDCERDVFIPGDGVCEPQFGENYLNSPEDCSPPYVIGDGICSPGEPAQSPDCIQEPPFIPGDGICEEEKGETWQNSPDCERDVFIPGDGLCEPQFGENHLNSPDCPPPQPPTFTPWSEFVDATGNPVDPLTTGTFRNVLAIPADREPAHPSDITYTFTEMQGNQRIYASNLIGPTRAGQVENRVFYEVTGTINVDPARPGTAWDLFQVEWHVPTYAEEIADSAQVYRP
jgi:hypothetical protein